MTDKFEIEFAGPVENLQLPNPALITYYKNLQNRTLWVRSEDF